MSSWPLFTVGGISGKPALWPQAESSLADGLSRAGHRPCCLGLLGGHLCRGQLFRLPSLQEAPPHFRQEVRLTAQVWGGQCPVSSEGIEQVPGHLSCWWSLHPHPAMLYLCLHLLTGNNRIARSQAFLLQRSDSVDVCPPSLAFCADSRIHLIYLLQDAAQGLHGENCGKHPPSQHPRPAGHWGLRGEGAAGEHAGAAWAGGPSGRGPQSPAGGEPVLRAEL